MAAVHLRDVHGVTAVNADMVGRIKRSFSNPSPIEAREAENLVLKEFKCSDIGNKCNFKYIAMTEDLIVDGVAVHAREAHGIMEFTQELKVKVANSLHAWKG